MQPFFKCLNPDQTASWILSALRRFVAIIHQYYRRCCKRDVRVRDKYRGMEPCQWAGTPVAIKKPSSCSQYKTKAPIFFRWRVMQWVRAKGMPRPLLIQHQAITVISPSHSVLKSENMSRTTSKRPQGFAWARSNLCAIGPPSKIHGTNPSDTCVHKKQENVKQHCKTRIFVFALGPTGQRVMRQETLKCVWATEETINHQSDYFFGLTEPRFTTMLDWAAAESKVSSYFGR